MRIPQILLIDVRRPDEIASIGGFAVYLNVQIGDLKNQLASIPRDRTIIRVSNQAARAGVAYGGTLVKFAQAKPRANATASAN